MRPEYPEKSWPCACAPFAASLARSWTNLHLFPNLHLPVLLNDMHIPFFFFCFFFSSSVEPSPFCVGMNPFLPLSVWSASYSISFRQNTLFE